MRYFFASIGHLGAPEYSVLLVLIHVPIRGITAHVGLRRDRAGTETSTGLEASYITLPWKHLGSATFEVPQVRCIGYLDTYM